MLLRSLPQLVTIFLSTLRLVYADPRNGNPDGEGETMIDGVPVNSIPGGQAKPAAQAVQDRTGWTVTADSWQGGNEPQNVLDGNDNTFWHTEWNPTNSQMPHQITVDMQSSRYVNGMTYEPRQDGSQNGNWGQHKMYLSNDGVNFGAPVAIGTFKNDQYTKNVVFAATYARYFRVVILTEGNGNPWASCAELNILSAPGPPPNPSGVGSWGPTINTPLVSVACALCHDTMRVLMWSSYMASTFTGGNGGMTVTASYDPGSQTVSQRVVTNTDHDMFCPGLSLDFGGKVFVTGGNDNQRASYYDPPFDQWYSYPNMLIGRGYQAQTTISDGRTFVIGGSWSGGQGGKNGELYSPNANTWYPLPGCPVGPMLTADNDGVFRADNHGWLFAWKDRTVFQAGPSSAMNWYGTDGQGSQAGAGYRANDGDSMNGNAVMFDCLASKILTVGGAANYQGGPDATANAHVITLGNSFENPQVEEINPMWYNRAFHNSVVLPDGKVFITGGQTNPQPFSDAGAQFTSELWDPNGYHFYKTAPQEAPRNYHSVAILLPDGTVFTAGGGLCGEGCAANHYDAQIYYPPYMYNPDGSRAARPTIINAPITVTLGSTIQITTDQAISHFAFMRFGSATHTVDTDQRRAPIWPSSNNGNTYTVVIPSDPGQMLPGYWMLFAITQNWIPSVATQLRFALP